jgi:hypothetical protein
VVHEGQPAARRAEDVGEQLSRVVVRAGHTGGGQPGGRVGDQLPRRA